MNLPEIRIKNAWLLRENASKHLNELWGDGRPLRAHEEYEEYAKKYRQAWRPYEEKILTGMCEITGLTFRQNIIDVYIAPWFGAFSDPMVLGVKHKPDQFIDVLTHELLHRLLTDNTTQPYELDHRKVWRKLFGDEHSFVTLVHIPVHAIHKAIYLDVLKDESRFERDVKTISEYPGYREAWDYVNNTGYKQIIKSLKNNY